MRSSPSHITLPALATPLLAFMLLAAPPPESRAATFGSDLQGDVTIDEGCELRRSCTRMLFSLDGKDAGSPNDGVVVRWRAVGTGEIRLRLVRREGDSWTAGPASELATVPVDGEPATFETRLPLKAGDFLAVDGDSVKPGPHDLQVPLLRPGRRVLQRGVGQLLVPGARGRRDARGHLRAGDARAARERRRRARRRRRRLRGRDAGLRRGDGDRPGTTDPGTTDPGTTDPRTTGTDTKHPGTTSPRTRVDDDSNAGTGSGPDPAPAGDPAPAATAPDVAAVAPVDTTGWDTPWTPPYMEYTVDDTPVPAFPDYWTPSEDGQGKRGDDSSHASGSDDSAAATRTGLGPPTRRCVVPKLHGATVSAAKISRRTSGRRIGTVKNARRGRANARRGRVVRQSVRAGRTVAAGMKVNVRVAR